MTSKTYNLSELAQAVRLNRIQKRIYHEILLNSGETFGCDCDRAMIKEFDRCEASIVWSCFDPNYKSPYDSKATFQKVYGFHPERLDIVNRVENVINNCSDSGITYEFDIEHEEFSLIEAGRKALQDFFISSDYITNDDFCTIALKIAYEYLARKHNTITSQQKKAVKDMILNEPYMQEHFLRSLKQLVDDYFNDASEESESPEAV